MQRTHLLRLGSRLAALTLAACGPANAAGGSAAGATSGTATGTPVPATAPTAGATNNPTPTSIGSSPANDHPADSTGRRPSASADTVHADTLRNH